ncbi:hypothetical protein KM043_006437 [Ampulex compressa]|nr:hypothetical protein KM043_006437 [Ampulex compressa]
MRERKEKTLSIIHSGQSEEQRKQILPRSHSSEVEKRAFSWYPGGNLQEARKISRSSQPSDLAAASFLLPSPRGRGHLDRQSRPRGVRGARKGTLRGLHRRHISPRIGPHLASNGPTRHTGEVPRRLCTTPTNHLYLLRATVEGPLHLPGPLPVEPPRTYPPEPRKVPHHLAPRTAGYAATAVGARLVRRTETRRAHVSPRRGPPRKG